MMPMHNIDALSSCMSHKSTGQSDFYDILFALQTPIDAHLKMDLFATILNLPYALTIVI